MQSIDPTFDEPPFPIVERAFEDLLLRGVLSGERVDRTDARVPAEAGPVFRALASRFRAVSLVEIGVVIGLHDTSVATDDLGGIRLASEPAELDVRLLPNHRVGQGAQGDAIVDATWSPHADDVAVHSTILHFLVRAAVGDRA